MNKRALFCRLNKFWWVASVSLWPSGLIQHCFSLGFPSTALSLDNTATNIDCSRTTKGSSFCKCFDHFTSPSNICCFHEDFKKSQINSSNQRNTGESQPWLCLCRQEQKSCTCCGQAGAFIALSLSIYQYCDCLRKTAFLTLSFDFHCFVSNFYMIGRTLAIKAFFKHSNIRSTMRFYSYCICILFTCHLILIHWTFPISTSLQNMAGDLHRFVPSAVHFVITWTQSHRKELEAYRNSWLNASMNVFRTGQTPGLPLLSWCAVLSWQYLCAITFFTLDSSKW